MKHRLLTTLALAALACAVVAAAAAGGGKGRLYQFRGELLATGANSVQVQVEGGNHAALKALIGQSQDETFTTGATTEFLGWTAGVPHVISIGDLKAGDNVQVSIRAKAGASLADILGDRRGARRRPRQRLRRARAARSSSTSAPSPAARPAATSRCTSPAATGAACARCSASRSTRRSPTTTARSSCSGRARCRP